MSQGLRALDALSGDLSLVHTIHVAAPNHHKLPSSRVLDLLFCVSLVPGMHVIPRNICRQNTHTHKIRQKFWLFLNCSTLFSRELGDVGLGHHTSFYWGARTKAGRACRLNARSSLTREIIPRGILHTSPVLESPAWQSDPSLHFHFLLPPSRTTHPHFCFSGSVSTKLPATKSLTQSFVL